MAGVDEAERALAYVDQAYARSDVDGVVAHLSAANRGFTAADEKLAAERMFLRALPPTPRSTTWPPATSS